MSFGRLAAQRGAYGQLPGLGLGSFWDELPAVVSSIQIGQKDVGTECAKWTGEVVKWQSKKPDLLNSSAKIAAKLAEAKANKARTCKAADEAEARAAEFYATSGEDVSTSGSWLSSRSPTVWIGLGIATALGVAWATRRRR